MVSNRNKIVTRSDIDPDSIDMIRTELDDVKQDSDPQT